MKNFFIPGLIITCFLMVAFKTPSRIVLEGAWKIVEVQTIKADGSYSSSVPTESLALFSKGYYSFTWTTHSSPSHNWNMSDSSKMNRFNQSIVNAGTYELKDDILTTRAGFAQNPMFVGGSATFKCSFSGDTLILTGQNVKSPDNVLHPLYAGGSHIVNKLVRIK